MADIKICKSLNGLECYVYDLFEEDNDVVATPHDPSHCLNIPSKRIEFWVFDVCVDKDLVIFWRA